MRYNKHTADPKCSIMNVNLYKGGFVVVGIDDPDTLDQNIKCFGDYQATRSMNRGLPHL